MEPSRTASTTSPAPPWGRSHSEKLSCSRPPLTSLYTSHETGATFVYHFQSVRFEWQSKHAPAASSRVRGESQRTALVTGGFVWSRP